jgi:hypothetical protein
MAMEAMPTETSREWLETEEELNSLKECTLYLIPVKVYHNRFEQTENHLKRMNDNNVEKIVQ